MHLLFMCKRGNFHTNPRRNSYTRRWQPSRVRVRNWDSIRSWLSGRFKPTWRKTPPFIRALIISLRTAFFTVVHNSSRRSSGHLFRVFGDQESDQDALDQERSDTEAPPRKLKTCSFIDDVPKGRKDENFFPRNSITRVVAVRTSSFTSNTLGNTSSRFLTDGAGYMTNDRQHGL